MALDELEITGELTDDCQFLRLDHWKMIRRAISHMRDKELEIRIRVVRNVRSERQNRYIWGVVVPMVVAWFKETTGETRTKEQVYAWLRVSLLGDRIEVVEMGGVDIITMTGKRFSKMNTKEFAEAIDIIRERMEEKGCYIPEPRKNNFITDVLTDD